MIGTKFKKDNYKSDEYVKAAVWCNNNRAVIIESGDYYEVVAIPEATLEEEKEAKIAELKQIRDNEEVQPIEYNGKLYDYDDKARDRINAAIIALDGTTQTLSWTTADNQEAIVNADDLKNIVRAVAVRSNELHTKYREQKEAVSACTTAAEVASIGAD